MHGAVGELFKVTVPDKLNTGVPCRAVGGEGGFGKRKSRGLYMTIEDLDGGISIGASTEGRGVLGFD